MIFDFTDEEYETLICALMSKTIQLNHLRSTAVADSPLCRNYEAREAECNSLLIRVEAAHDAQEDAGS